ncbi:COG1470 family protein [Pyrococcus yayanosii]|uniref:CARDB domain-containing protein n=1 Tax=Pyrococcus yayanosii (strain CH1 / JCM 16557) TaxID=529709 RepID=F8AEQ7_PYRYC|nr:carboxypeptidase regulatory-like domain-containing protein [Pyrococcus yayanosii]AEH24739.1 hypothetical protein PYCH_10580 [Pyrococcus yayanosii CH1]
MRKLAIFFAVLMLINFPVGAQSSLTLEVNPNYLEGLPGEVLHLNVTVRNAGSEPAENVTVYIAGPVRGILFTQAFIRLLPPGNATNVTLTIYINDAQAGVYELKVVARFGSQLVEVPFRLRVKSVIGYSLSIEGAERYLYGKDVGLLLTLSSKANSILIGTVEFKLYMNGSLLKGERFIVYLSPGETWRRSVKIERPEPGNYTAVLSADFYGVRKEVSLNFTVYRRDLRYSVSFENGAIVVRVTEGNRPVSGIPVTIGNTTMLTDESGMVEYPVSEPGTYRVVLNLDEKIVETVVDVKRPILMLRQEGSELVVRVLDPTGSPIAEVPVVAVGPEGKAYGTTDANGTVRFDGEDIGYGLITVIVESSRYLSARESITLEAPTSTPLTMSPTYTETSISQATTPPITPSPNYTPSLAYTKGSHLPLILFIFLALFATSSYVAFFRPLVVEDRLGRYYFVKIRAPKLRALHGFRYEKAAKAIEAWATKGDVKIEDGKVVWEIDELEPGEEATLQIFLA